MTKKHYEAIAAMFKPYMTHPAQNIARPLAKDLADYFEIDNKNFNRTMFLTACGIDQS